MKTKEDEPMEMGKEIRRLRQDRGLTQEALAAALNVTAQTVSKWECGNSIPDVQLLPEIAVYFGVSIDQLFAMTPQQQMERIENRIYARGLFDEAEERQLEQQLGAFAEDPALGGAAACQALQQPGRAVSAAGGGARQGGRGGDEGRLRRRQRAHQRLGQLYLRLERAEPSRPHRLAQRLLREEPEESVPAHVAPG